MPAFLAEDDADASPGASPTAPADGLTVTVVASPAPRRVERRTLRLSPGATLADAVRLSGLLLEVEGLAGHASRGELQLSVWGRRREPTALASAGDRIELCRPLTVDPKEARRLRYRKQGDRGRVRRKRPEPDAPEPVPRSGDDAER
jgi:putative ubiquitin-RnfH superfamily antitoxin RatB of RatAB toxin-antitoxin module